MVSVLLAILFCLALQRFANVGGWFQVSWFEGYLKILSSFLSKLDERVGILAIVMPVLLLFLVLHFIALWSFSNLIMLTAVLFFCIDARDLKRKLTPYFDSLDKGDTHAAANVVFDFISDDAIGNVAELPRAVTRAILLKSFERFFVGLFWFMLFREYGVATYFMMTLLRQSALKVNPNYIELAKLAAKAQVILEWLPARLLGFSYALVGHFNKGFNYCSKYMQTGLSEVKKFVVDSGLAALDVSPTVSDADQIENRAALDIVNRVLIVWILSIILVLIGVIL